MPSRVQLRARYPPRSSLTFGCQTSHAGKGDELEYGEHGKCDARGEPELPGHGSWHDGRDDHNDENDAHEDCRHVLEGFPCVDWGYNQATSVRRAEPGR